MNEPTLIQRGSLVEVLVKAGVPTKAISCPDFTYALPSYEWIKQLGEWDKEQMQKLGLTYTEDGWDCDDYSEWVRLWARVAHQRTNGRRDDSIAVGWFDYMTKDYVGHSIVCAVCRQTPAKLRFFEPQQEMREVFLTQKEIESCIEMRM